MSFPVSQSERLQTALRQLLQIQSPLTPIKSSSECSSDPMITVNGSNQIMTFLQLQDMELKSIESSRKNDEKLSLVQAEVQMLRDTNDELNSQLVSMKEEFKNFRMSYVFKSNGLSRAEGKAVVAYWLRKKAPDAILFLYSCASLKRILMDNFSRWRRRKWY